MVLDAAVGQVVGRVRFGRPTPTGTRAYSRSLALLGEVRGEARREAVPTGTPVVRGEARRGEARSPPGVVIVLWE